MYSCGGGGYDAGLSVQGSRDNHTPPNRKELNVASPNYSRPHGKNYLGNRNTTEVHDLRLETTNCQIDEIIRAGNAVTFTPDTLTQARVEGYDNCFYCIGNSKR